MTDESLNDGIVMIRSCVNNFQDTSAILQVGLKDNHLLSLENNSSMSSRCGNGLTSSSHLFDGVGTATSGSESPSVNEVAIPTFIKNKLSLATLSDLSSIPKSSVRKIDEAMSLIKPSKKLSVSEYEDLLLKEVMKRILLERIVKECENTLLSMKKEMTSTMESQSRMSDEKLEKIKFCNRREIERLEQSKRDLEVAKKDLKESTQIQIENLQNTINDLKIKSKKESISHQDTVLSLENKIILKSDEYDNKELEWKAKLHELEDHTIQPLNEKIKLLESDLSQSCSTLEKYTIKMELLHAEVSALKLLSSQKDDVLGSRETRKHVDKNIFYQDHNFKNDDTLVQKEIEHRIIFLVEDLQIQLKDLVELKRKCITIVEENENLKTHNLELESILLQKDEIKTTNDTLIHKMRLEEQELLQQNVRKDKELAECKIRNRKLSKEMKELIEKSQNEQIKWNCTKDSLMSENEKAQCDRNEINRKYQDTCASLSQSQEIAVRQKEKDDALISKLKEENIHQTVKLKEEYNVIIARLHQEINLLKSTNKLVQDDNEELLVQLGLFKEIQCKDSEIGLATIETLQIELQVLKSDHNALQLVSKDFKAKEEAMVNKFELEIDAMKTDIMKKDAELSQRDSDKEDLVETIKILRKQLENKNNVVLELESITKETALEKEELARKLESQRVHLTANVQEQDIQLSTNKKMDEKLLEANLDNLHVLEKDSLTEEVDQVASLWKKSSSSEVIELSRNERQKLEVHTTSDQTNNKTDQGRLSKTVHLSEDESFTLSEKNETELISQEDKTSSTLQHPNLCEECKKLNHLLSSSNEDRQELLRINAELQKGFKAAEHELKDLRKIMNDFESFKNTSKKNNGNEALLELDLSVCKTEVDTACSNEEGNQTEIYPPSKLDVDTNKSHHNKNNSKVMDACADAAIVDFGNNLQNDMIKNVPLNKDDAESIEFMREKLTFLAKALENAEYSRSMTMERIYMERKEHAEGLRKIADSVKSFYAQITCGD